MQAASERKLKAEMRKLGKRLDTQQALAKKALAKLGRRSAAASGPLNAGLRKAWRDVEAAVRQATRRFHETA